MYIVTNREVVQKGGSEIGFGPGFNRFGPDELRLAEAKKARGKWVIKILAESRPGDRTATAGKSGPPPSEIAFKALQKRMAARSRNCVFFVHGFNNTLEDALERGAGFEKAYNVEVIVFSWPANGGGLQGVKSYKEDKRDARMSANALDRAFEKLSFYLKTHAAANCPQTLNLVLHSMGNYLLKNLVGSSVYQGETLIFDNIVLAAADVNNPGHAEWVDRLAYRKRLYITINENDSALGASRMKASDEQQTRLGHYPYDLSARNAVYLDFTDAKGVGTAHAYFEGATLTANPLIKFVFTSAFNGRAAETSLTHDPRTGAFRIKKK